MKIDRNRLDLQMARHCIKDKKQLSDMAGVSYGKIKRAYSTGGTGETIGKIAKALGVDVLDIIADDTKPENGKDI